MNTREVSAIKIPLRDAIIKARGGQGVFDRQNTELLRYISTTGLYGQVLSELLFTDNSFNGYGRDFLGLDYSEELLKSYPRNKKEGFYTNSKWESDETVKQEILGVLENTLALLCTGVVSALLAYVRQRDIITLEDVKKSNKIICLIAQYVSMRLDLFGACDKYDKQIEHQLKMLYKANILSEVLQNNPELVIKFYFTSLKSRLLSVECISFLNLVLKEEKYQAQIKGWVANPANKPKIDTAISNLIEGDLEFISEMADGRVTIKILLGTWPFNFELKANLLNIMNISIDQITLLVKNTIAMQTIPISCEAMIREAQSQGPQQNYLTGFKKGLVQYILSEIFSENNNNFHFFEPRNQVHGTIKELNRSLFVSNEEQNIINFCDRVIKLDSIILMVLINIALGYSIFNFNGGYNTAIATTAIFELKDVLNKKSNNL